MGSDSVGRTVARKVRVRRRTKRKAIGTTDWGRQRADAVTSIERQVYGQGPVQQAGRIECRAPGEVRPAYARTRRRRRESLGTGFPSAASQGCGHRFVSSEGGRAQNAILEVFWSSAPAHSTRPLPSSPPFEFCTPTRCGSPVVAASAPDGILDPVCPLRSKLMFCRGRPSRMEAFRQNWGSARASEREAKPLRRRFRREKRRPIDIALRPHTSFAGFGQLGRDGASAYYDALEGCHCIHNAVLRAHVLAQRSGAVSRPAGGGEI